MGMPGSETILEELMCRVLGDLVEGVVAKIADDLYCGGNAQLEFNTKKLDKGSTGSAKERSKFVCYKNDYRTQKYNYSWMDLLNILCQPPVKVCGLRSFIGAYKVLARVIPDCASLLGKLDDDVAGRESKESIQWSDELTDIFSQAQKALSTNRSIFLPQPNDQLWIVTDSSVKNMA
ncbi:unnamed protein product [Mytilus coruscus]|uniref:Reverse transcriptase/retrotransposon-derived protein RNase H-like domain-containing protein n=1 Tax=Mytilus coruscus TaxID=42192 RepID=A0A6J8DDY5_MYTCO|nr:unnamed protein product [Mytilus coruscus]